MVARTPPKKQGKLMVAPPLSPTLIRQTLQKVEQCMERLQELQYTVTGGNKVVGGVKLSPTTTKAYLKTSLRCKQEFSRIKSNAPKKSPTGKQAANATGEWRRMSLPAMLLNETVAEILQATQFTKQAMETTNNVDPKTPVTNLSQKQKRFTTNMEKTPIEARRKREKQHKFRIIHAESRTPSIHRARSRINFKETSPKRLEVDRENSASKRYIANRVSPKHKPWGKKTVLFPNPLFHSSPTTQKQQFCKTKSPIITTKKRDIPHKFVVKSPVKIKSGSVTSPVRYSSKPMSLNRKISPPRPVSTSSKLRRSLSPSRLVNRLVSPLKSRRMSMYVGSGNGDGLKQKPPPLMMMPKRFSAPRIVVGMDE